MATEVCMHGNRTGAVTYYYVDAMKSIPMKKRPWVCSSCLLPRRPLYERYIKRCEECLDEFSSPLENICGKCHRLQYADITIEKGRIEWTFPDDYPAYQGWAWLVTQERSGVQRMLDWHRQQGHMEDDPNAER